MKTRGFVGDQRGLDVIGADLGGDDDAGHLTTTAIVACGAEERGNGFRAVHLEEFADLWLLANVLMDRA